MSQDIQITVVSVVKRKSGEPQQTQSQQQPATATAPQAQQQQQMAGGGGVLEMLGAQGQFANLSQRGRLALEFLTTERAYTQGLRQTIAAYLLPLRAGVCPAFKQRLIPVVFLNVERILDANTAFLRDLEYHLYSPNFLTNGNANGMFSLLLPALELYPEYVKNHWRAILEVNKNEHTVKEFQLFLQRAKEASEAKLDLLSCLIAPVQRIPRYRLLLADILKHTDAGSVDRDHIESVHKYVSDLAERVNGDMRRQENFQRQIKLQHAFVGNIANIASYDRTLVRDGQLLKRVRYGSSKPRWFFLFNDCLIYAKTVQIPSVGVIETYEGHLFSLCRFLSHISARNAPNEGETGFEIVSLQKSFTVFAETPEEKQAWLAAIKSVGGTEGSHAPVWMADTETTKCLLCEQKFTLTLRRHHCRNCGCIVCGQCSTQRARLAHLDVSSDPVRVCDKCAQTLGLPKIQRNQSFMRLLNRFIPRMPPPSPMAATATSSQAEPEFSTTRVDAHPMNPQAMPLRPEQPAPRPPSTTSSTMSTSPATSPVPAVLSTKSPTQKDCSPHRLGRPRSLQMPHPPAFAIQLRQRSASSPGSLAGVQEPVSASASTRDLISLDETPAAAAPSAQDLLDFGLMPAAPTATSAHKPSEDLLSFATASTTEHTPSPGLPPVSPTPTKRNVVQIPGDVASSPLAALPQQQQQQQLQVLPPRADNPQPTHTSPATPSTPSVAGRPQGMGLFLLSPCFESSSSPRTPDALDPWASARSGQQTATTTVAVATSSVPSLGSSVPDHEPILAADEGNPFSMPSDEEEEPERVDGATAVEEDNPFTISQAVEHSAADDDNPFSPFIAPK